MMISFNSLIENYDAEVVSFLLTLLAYYLLYLFRGRVIILFSELSSFNHLLDAPDGEKILVHTKTVFFQNFSRNAGKAVDVILSEKPNGYSIWPQRTYSEKIGPHNQFIIRIEALPPREFQGVEVIHVGREITLLNITCENGNSKAIRMWPQFIWPTWLNLLAFSFMMLGIFLIFYLLYQIIV